MFDVMVPFFFRVLEKGDHNMQAHDGLDASPLCIWGVLPSVKRPEGRAARGRPGAATSGNDALLA